MRYILCIYMLYYFSLNVPVFVVIKEAFYMFDPGNSGRMETKDLGTAVRSLGQNPSEAQIKTMIKEADRRGTHRDYISYVNDK